MIQWKYTWSNVTNSKGNVPTTFVVVSNRDAIPATQPVTNTVLMTNVKITAQVFLCETNSTKNR